ncbi:hypothetical protein B9Y88_15115 [Stenotrophomonas maltophilia]|nr:MULTISPECIES: hypothetical protein [unclassified Stenotrophomonas]MDH1243207.1 hypothetical protein [Stenotrophomonas sp. GD03948]MDH1577493.1 hypothetical protein [Stenotrophomonas sp. GD03744]PJL77214.1 hypothetical protein B9Y88_15115 [Stenotrophomonas maltophilia]PZQ25165.1 MAG: hypothetical protein DI562_17030 [Stenotrophomonas acidaminiphila]
MSSNHEDTSAAGAGGTDAAAAAAGAAGAGDAASLLQQGAGEEAAWLPEKYRVKVDGKDEIDFQASARKLGEGYRALEAKLGSGATGTVPENPDSYQLAVPTDAEGKALVEGVDLQDFMADPIYKDLAAKAHAKGISNEAMQFFVGEYLQFAPQLFEANLQLGADEARQTLSAVWKDDAAMKAGLASAARAAQGFAAPAGQPGNYDNVMQKFGNDPDFLALMASIGKEMGEDKPISSDPVAAADWQDQVDALKANPAYMDKSHPQHASVVRQVSDMYQKRYGTQQRQLGATAVR